MVKLSEFNISLAIRRDVETSGVFASHCPICKGQLTKIHLVGEFNGRLYTVENCKTCQKNFLVVYWFKEPPKNRKTIRKNKINEVKTNERE